MQTDASMENAELVPKQHYNEIIESITEKETKIITLASQIKTLEAKLAGASDEKSVKELRSQLEFEQAIKNGLLNDKAENERRLQSYKEDLQHLCHLFLNEELSDIKTYPELKQEDRQILDTLRQMFARHDIQIHIPDQRSARPDHSR